MYGRLLSFVSANEITDEFLATQEGSEFLQQYYALEGLAQEARMEEEHLRIMRGRLGIEQVDGQYSPGFRTGHSGPTTYQVYVN